MTNNEIAAVFDEIADVIEFQGESPFRVRAYRLAARTISGLDTSVQSLVEPTETRATTATGHSDGVPSTFPAASLPISTRSSDTRAAILMEIPSIGKDLSEKILELLDTGECQFLTELRQAVPTETLDLMKIPGLGPKNAARLHQELGIRNVLDLKIACSDGIVHKLKGFGEKLEKKLLAGIGFFTEHDPSRLLWVQAEKLVKLVTRHLKERVPSILRIEAAGSFRRLKETVGDIDLLVVAADTDSEAVFDAFAELAKNGSHGGNSGKTNSDDAVLVRGETKMSILHSSVDIAKPTQVDCRIVSPESFGAALQYFTGSQAHNVELRKRAKERGLLLNEYGLFPVEEGVTNRNHTVRDKTTRKSLPVRDESDVYRNIGLPWIPPELREMRREFAWAETHSLPELITLDDLRGDLHSHTNATDGLYTAEAMILAAKARGLEYFAITDHSKRVGISNGLNEKQLLAQWQMMDETVRRLKDTTNPSGSGSGGITILKGVEVDILEAGGLDISDEVLSQADWVVASLHFGQNQSESQITRRLLDAIENPNVSVIGHPTGRIINDRPPYSFDEETIFAAAAQHGVFLELNSHPKRLDLDDIHCMKAKKLGIKIVISSDAHTVDGLSVTRFGINQARRAGLTKDDVANTRTWPELKSLLRTKTKWTP